MDWSGAFDDAEGDVGGEAMVGCRVPVPHARWITPVPGKNKRKNETHALHALAATPRRPWKFRPCRRAMC